MPLTETQPCLLPDSEWVGIVFLYVISYAIFLDDHGHSVGKFLEVYPKTVYHVIELRKKKD